MRQAVFIRAEQRDRLPTAAELRAAGFAVSAALGRGREEDAPGRDVERARDAGPPDRAGPLSLPEQERQRP